MSQQQTLVDRHEVTRLTGFSRPWIYAAMKAGRFPRPIKIGPRSVRWVLADVQTWISEMIQEDELRRSDLADG